MSGRIGRYGVIVTALATALLNLGYGVGLLGQFLDFSRGAEFQHAAISAIAALSGIVLVLAWVALDPLRRRAVLILMIVPLQLGNLLHTINLHASGDAGLPELGVNLAFGVLYAGVHVGVYWLAGAHGAQRSPMP